MTISLFYKKPKGIILIIIDDIAQGSPEWFKLKAGIPSASSFKKIVTSKGEPSKQRKDYLYELADDAIKGTYTPGYQSKEMKAGTENEPESLKLYAFINNVELIQPGFVFDDNRMYGCSPDSIIEKWTYDYGLEVKNVLGKTQIKYLLFGKLPTDYFQQVQGSLLITGFDRWDFFSRAPKSPDLDLFILEVEPDLKFQSKLKEQLEAFCFELAKIIKQLKDR